MEFNMNEENVGEPDGEFAFETDHLALRSNKDYGELLKYIVKLEAQKTKVLKDLEYLAEAQNKALEEPIAFVQKLQAGKVHFPPRQVISDLPKIDWDQYGIESTQDDNDKDIKPDLEELIPKVRGRQFTDSKPETFNQLWSIEEQKRLEELLEVYQEEPIEAKRYKKIADALGTRTPLQVMSRMQKYFAKLAKAGLPIPGRAPKGTTYREKNKSSSAMFYKKSSFFPQLHVPVKMEAADESYISESVPTTDTNSGDRAMLELLKAAKEQRMLDESFPVWQTKTMCVGCQKTKFVGARWTDNAGTDYCTDCVVKLLPSEKLIPIRN